MHTQPRKVNIGFQKAHMMEIQVNGGSIADKVDFAYGLFEKEVRCARPWARSGYAVQESIRARMP